MIIGTGMIAKKFKTSPFDNEKYLFFASGVSNSNADNPDQFQREADLLQTTIQNNSEKIIIYFSSCDIVNIADHSFYYKHKLKMEQMIQEQSQSYYIFRLPQLAGKTQNKNTVINYFYYHIFEGTHFEAWSKARRNIIDIDDVVKVINVILDQKKIQNQITNIASTHNYSVLDIIKIIEYNLGKKGNYQITKKGHSSSFDVSSILEIAKELKIDFKHQYLERILAKYNPFLKQD